MAKYFFSKCELDTDRHELRVAGVVRHIEPQVFDLLRLFAESGDTLLTREDLIRRIWKNRVVTDSSISVRVNAARRAVGDNGASQDIIRTVPRRGFKLAVDVHREENASAAPPAESRPVIAVFAFESNDDGPADYLPRGIADDIATELSRFHTIVVLSTYSTFQHDANREDTRDFAAALGATHIITGSIQTDGPRTRLTVRLGDVATSHSIWSERYEIAMAELFEARDDAVYSIVGNLISRLRDEQFSAARRKPTSQLSAYDCVLRGLRIYKSGEVTLEEAKQAMFWFERAVELDPQYARALAWRACCGANFWSNPPTREDIEAPARDMELAVSVDPGDHEVHRLKGALHMLSREYDLADYHLSKSVELNPNDAHILLRIGYYRSFLGDVPNAMTYVDLAFKRNPLHPPWYWHDRGVVLFAHEHYEESLQSLVRSQSDADANLVFKAACYAALGELSKASSAIADARSANSDLTIDWLRTAYPYRCYKDRTSVNRLAGFLVEGGLR